MAVLYSRDYNLLTNDEIDEKKQLESENKNPNSMFSVNLYYDYPKAIRHNESLFPNNFIDNADLQQNCEALSSQCDGFEVLLNSNITELDIKRYIQKNEYYHIPASIFKYYNFGHHAAYVFNEFRLGTYFSADYLLVGDSSDRHQFIFVEFENAYGNITIGDGDFGDTIRKGINQINDWKAFIQSNYSTITAEFKKHTTKQLPDEFYDYDATRMNFVVVAGRRNDFNDKTRRLRRSLEKDSEIKLLHYDNLVDIARSTIGNWTYQEHIYEI